jgi:multiple sugar transport system ATP-binding protein
MRGEIKRLQMELGITSIYVTHDQVEAMTMASRIAVMKDGILHQVDTPQNLYDLPTNVFVAGFIGSPAMNFFKARLERADGGLVVDSGAFQIRVPDTKVESYRAHAGKQVIFGIRPDDIHDPAFAPPSITPANVETKVDVTELMGNEIFMHLMMGDTSAVGRIDPRSKLNVGDMAQLVFNLDNMHLFDADTEKAIRN